MQNSREKSRGILVADSGSTKTDWVFAENGTELLHFQSEGMNPKYLSKKQLHEIFNDQIVEKIGNALPEAVYFYGAGCSGQESRRKLRDVAQVFFTTTSIAIEHDLLGAARACFQHNEGLVAILGTGSNVAYYDGREVHERFPSLGYLLGDEGSGTDLGKELVKNYVLEKFDNEIVKLFQSKYKFTSEQLIVALYEARPPNRFLAQFAPFILEHAQHPQIDVLIKGCLRRFFETQLYQYNNYRNLDIKFVGSIAHFFRDQLKAVGDELGLRLRESIRYPIHHLVEFHSR
jgi:N-acetylglucosamine kinase-like BadF-type ATPase